jgi:hypothetical protein
MWWGVWQQRCSLIKFIDAAQMDPIDPDGGEREGGDWCDKGGFGYFRLLFTWVIVAGMGPDHPRADVIGWNGDVWMQRDKTGRGR